MADLESTFFHIAMHACRALQQEQTLGPQLGHRFTNQRVALSWHSWYRIHSSSVVA